MTRIRDQVNGKVLEPPDGGDDFNGPIKGRQCRDVVFLILFIAFVAGSIGYLVFVSFWADPKRLIHGHDKYGNVCGRSNPYITGVDFSGMDYSNHPLCDMKKPQITTAKNILNQGLNGAPCDVCTDKCIEPSTQLGFYCTHLNLREGSNRTDIATKAVFGISLSEFIETIGRDLEISGTTLALLAVIALALGLLVTLMLRFLAQVVVWIVVIAMVVGSIGGTAYLWILWHFRKRDLEQLKAQGIGLLGDLEDLVWRLMVGAIAASVFTFILLVLLIAMRNRIRLVIALFKEAGKSVGAMPLLMLQPLWTCVWLGVACLVWLAGWLLIASSGEPKKVDDGVVFEIIPFIQHMRWYHLFSLLWVTQFIVACQDVIIAGAVAEWYFTRNKSLLGWPILTSMGRLFRYHLGSVALGSLLIAIVKFIRIILKNLEKRLSGSNNSVCSFCLKCCQCCLCCFEKFLKFLSRNAYIEIAIYGYSFCKAAQKAFSLLVNNAFRVAAINSVGAFVLILTKLVIVSITIAIGYLILRTKDDLTYLWVPLVVVFIYSYFIAHCFISVYEMCIDTLFLCFCEDCERNDGLTKPYYMSRGLMQFVENSKKALEALDARQKDKELRDFYRSNAVHPTAVRPSTGMSTNGKPNRTTTGVPNPAFYMIPAG